MVHLLFERIREAAGVSTGISRPGPKVQISSDGGTDHVWKRAGEELCYPNGDNMMVVSVTTAPTFKTGWPQDL